jgi:hypothetical protein
MRPDVLPHVYLPAGFPQPPQPGEIVGDNPGDHQLHFFHAYWQPFFHHDHHPLRVNDSQSTHYASVHQTVSESAIRLFSHYGSKIHGSHLSTVISRVQFYVGSLSDGYQKNIATKCFSRITAPDYTFTDPCSNITTTQLLALTFLAISDNDIRDGSLEDARAQFIEGLYEIQRGYNLSDMGVDEKPGERDQVICYPGTFNKLIEKLQGIHPDCQIRFITANTASLKLRIVAKEEAMRYMKSLANPNTAEDLRAFTRLISQVKKNGVEVIWDQIEGNVADRMFDEFGSLYRDRADHSFTGLVDAGQYTKLPDLSIFQEQVDNSKAYHQYCSQMLRQSGMFFSDKTSAEYLSKHRHGSPEAQEAYDRQFGLVIHEPNC